MTLQQQTARPKAAPIAPASGSAALTSRLLTLLPSLDDAQLAPIANAAAIHVEDMITRCWGDLVGKCEAMLASSARAALRKAVGSLPDKSALLPRLHDLITPAVLVRLEVPDVDRLTRALLSHPDAELRERTLDALSTHAGGYHALLEACNTWSRRMLVADLDGPSALSHTDRLKLRERLLAEGGELETAVPQPQVPCEPDGNLRQALRQAQDCRASLILAERASVPPSLVNTAMRRRDAGMLLSICWKAGCNPDEILAVQVQLGRLGPDGAMRVTAENQWPLRTAAMQWRVSLQQDD